MDKKLYQMYKSMCANIAYHARSILVFHETAWRIAKKYKANPCRNYNSTPFTWKLCKPEHFTTPAPTHTAYLVHHDEIQWSISSTPATLPTPAIHQSDHSSSLKRFLCTSRNARSGFVLQTATNYVKLFMWKSEIITYTYAHST